MFLAIPRDVSQESNCITIDSEGNPVINYVLTQYDKDQMMAGLEAQYRLHRAAGSKLMVPLKEGGDWFWKMDDDEAFDAYVKQVVGVGVPVSTMPVFSAHQMSSCRMGHNSSVAPVNLTGELFECSGLYVADGSVLPTSLGVNPMVTIEAFAYMIAQNIVDVLQKE